MEEEADPMECFDVDVFESKFIRWGELPPHIKITVLQNLPYPTLRNFMFLSKESYALASTVVTDAYGVYLLDMNFLAGLRDDVRRC
ncbi:hypothetical protein RB195_005946 [Necator americanus]